ncbi:hypothetical protein D1R32_gp334 [Tunisvirus fontaine2]|uniref:Uncharacterized protein n=1 Tax=Tunisvirus fontaine2 TaxID=1421067 RepID=V9SFE0_9VIRU|nr:hypothetical protein D1R32_gp334 [Tunisvirus fontaine2]AHC55051.1 hypothetical protein TNS_ORF333 [Tunisvirus fontaine2]
MEQRIEQVKERIGRLFLEKADLSHRITEDTPIAYLGEDNKLVHLNAVSINIYQKHDVSPVFSWYENHDDHEVRFFKHRETSFPKLLDSVETDANPYIIQFYAEKLRNSKKKIEKLRQKLEEHESDEEVSETFGVVLCD